MSFDPSTTLPRLQQTLNQLETGALRPDVVCARFRIATLDWNELPERYGSVLEQLLAPLDVAVKLGDVGGSFSRAEVVQSLRNWLEHAAQLTRH